MRKSLALLGVACAFLFAAGYAFACWHKARFTQNVTAAFPSTRAFTRTLADEVSALLSEPDPIARRLAMIDMIDRLDAWEARRLFLAATEDISLRRAAGHRWAQSDPRGMLEYLRSLRDDEWSEMENSDEIRDTLFRTWARHEPEAALKAAKQVSREPHFYGVDGAALIGILQEDPERGFALAREHGVEGVNDLIKSSLWEKNPAGFVKASLSLPPGDNLRHLAFNSSDQRDGENRSAVDLWAERDLEGALRYLTELKDSRDREYLLPPIIKNLAARDFTRAAELFDQLPASREKEGAGAVLAAEMAKQNPQGALEWIDANLKGTRASAYANWARTMAESAGLEATAAMVLALPPGTGRDQAGQSLLDRWAQKDVKSAVAWLQAQPYEADVSQAMVNVIGNRWIEKNPDEFSQFVVANPNYAWNSWQYGIAARHLAETNLDSLPQWLGTLPEATALRAARELTNRSYWFDNNQWLLPPDDYAPLFEKLPAKFHSAMVESAVDRLLWSDQLADFAKSLPDESLRQIARKRIEAAPNLAPADRSKLLEQVR